MMTSADVLEILQRLCDAGIEVWLDGGWGIDALLGEQTRDHDDLDFVLELARTDSAVEALSGMGFAITTDERPTRVVLKDSDGLHIDIHIVVFDEGGGGVQALPGGRSYRYPPEGFSGQGRVGGEFVPCVTAAVQIECHQGYPPTYKDRCDLALLAERFGLKLPRAYRAD